MDVEDFKKKSKRMPEGPGVYFFLGKKKKMLYIGKATSLRDRTRSYFSSDLGVTRGALLVDMIQKATTIEWRETDSVLEALLLEASLVRLYKPPHNTDLKDDKSFNYVVVTKEDFPRVLVVRGKELAQQNPSKGRDEHDPNSLLKGFAAQYTFGPFPHGSQLKEAMKLIRKIFPFRDTCTIGQKKPCFNAQIGLCPGVCVGDITKQEYRRTIRHIALLFEGKKKQLLTALTKNMRAAAVKEDFELAKEFRRQMYALQHIQDVSLIKDEYRSPSVGLGALRTMRIEAYDVAHLQGSSAVGVMVMVEDGLPNKAAYRKFTIKSAKPGDDAGALREILSRRLGHNEWTLPRLIVVDGSTAQINAAEKVLAQYGVHIPVVGVVKDEKHRPRTIAGDRSVIKDKERDILLANNEAHRFAIGFHRTTSRKKLTME